MSSTSHDMYSHDGIQYTLGVFATGVTAFFADMPVGIGAVLAAILPALVLLIVNLPKFLREALLLYREYKRTHTKYQTDRS